MPKFRVETTNGTYIVETEDFKPGSPEWVADREAQLAKNYEKYDQSAKSGGKAPDTYKAPAPTFTQRLRDGVAMGLGPAGVVADAVLQSAQAGTGDFSLGGLVQGGINTAKGLFDIGKRILTPPETTSDKVAFGVAGPLGPLVTDVVRNQVGVAGKAVDAAQQGNYREAAGYGLATFVPGGAELAEKVGEGKISEAGGDILSGAAVPKVIQGVKSIPVLPKLIKDGLKKQSDIDARDFAHRRHVPLDAANEYGSEMLADVQGHVGSSFGGSGIARPLREAQNARMSRVGDELLNDVSPNAASPETAGAGMRRGVNETISTENKAAGRDYETLREIERDPANLERVQQGVDADGKPVYEEVQFPLDQRALKPLFKELEQEFLSTLTPFDQSLSKPLLAVRRILNGPDHVPVSVAEKNLGILKKFKKDGEGAVNAGESLAAKAVRAYDLAIRERVKQAQRTAPKPAAGPTVTPAAPAAGAFNPAPYTDNAPPVQPGHVRLYRGEHPTKHDSSMFDSFPGEKPDGGSGGWFTSDLNEADYYRSSQGPGAQIVYMDVPEAAAKARRATDLPEFSDQQTPGGMPRFSGSEYFFNELRKAPAPGAAPDDLLRTRFGRTKFGPDGETPVTAAAPNLAGVVGTGEARIRIPGENTTYKGRYEVRELGDLEASHNGRNFQKNPNYQLANDRDYTTVDNQGKVLQNSSPEQFDALELINDSPSATTGPMVIDAAGNVLGGNGRKMTLDRVYGRDGSAYRSALEAKAAQFGLDPEAIRGMKQPVLVRVVDDADLPDTAARQRAITDFNKKGTAELTPAERAIADSKRVSQGTLDDISRRLSEKGDDSTLAQVLEGEAGGEVLQKLIDDGVINAGERNALATGAILTKAGRDRISSLMLGRFFRDPATLDALPASIRNKLERLAAPLSKAEPVAGWGLTGTIRDAIDLLEEARATGTANLDDYIKQGGLFVEQNYSAQAIQLAKQLQSGKPRALEAAAQRYAGDAAFSEGGSLFGDAPTPAKSFAEAFGGELGETVPFDARPGANAAAGAAAARKSTTAPAGATRPKVIGVPAGDEAWNALKAGRKHSYQEWRADRVLKKLSAEPVNTFKRLTADRDLHIEQLRAVAKEAPAEVEGLARAYTEGLLDQLKDSDFADAAKVKKAWDKLGPETKKILFKNEVLRKNLDDFFQLAENIEKRSKSGAPKVSHPVVSFTAGVGLVIWSPMTAGTALLGAGAKVLGNRAVAKMLFTPRGVQALKNGLRVPVNGNRAAAVLASGQILKMAGKDFEDLPKAAANRPSQSSEERLEVASR
jgi:hypothetical protein